MAPGAPRPATPADRLAVARLIHASTNAWYAGKGAGPVFGCPPDDCAVYFDVYETLDPGHCLVVRDEPTGTRLGSCECRGGLRSLRQPAAGDCASGSLIASSGAGS